MEEIKFRGKRKDNGEWIYGYFYKNMDLSIKNLFKIHIFDKQYHVKLLHFSPRRHGSS